MKYYFEKLEERILTYKSKYRNRPGKAAAKLAWWNLKCALKRHKRNYSFISLESDVVREKNTASFSLSTDLEENDNVLRIAVAEGGGIGDSLFVLTYLKEFRKLFNRPVVIDFYTRAYQAFQNFPFINKCMPYSQQHCMDDYDVYIVSRRFYIVCKLDEDKTRFFSEKFYDFCKWCRYLTDEVLVGEYNDNLFSQYALLFGKNRLEQANVAGILPIDRTTPKYFQWDENEFGILQKYGLEEQKYITICRAVDAKYGNSHPKLWPLAYYRQLVDKIKKKYPEVKLVQIGSGNVYGEIDGVDVCLVGQTTLEQSKVILKYSMLHIDGEGGLVHMKNFLNGCSVVMFGPTNPDIFGYSQNYNLRSSVCTKPCEWVIRGWTEGCMRGFDVPLCMQFLLPEAVFEKVCEHMSSLADWKYEVSERNVFDCSSFSVLKGGKAAQIMRSGNDGFFENQFLRHEYDLIVYDRNLSLDDEKYGAKNCAYVAYAKEHGFCAEYATPYNVPAENETFDVVFCEMMDSVFSPKHAIMEALRILKDGGTFIFKLAKERWHLAGGYVKGCKDDGKYIYISKRKK